jgi:hypothetical protein
MSFFSIASNVTQTWSAKNALAYNNSLCGGVAARWHEVSAGKSAKLGKPRPLSLRLPALFSHSTSVAQKYRDFGVGVWHLRDWSFVNARGKHPPIFSCMRVGLAALLSFNGGFVGWLAGLFTGHVTGMRVSGHQ